MEDTPVDEIYNWEGAYAPYRLPKGYHYIETIPLGSHVKVIYKNTNGGKVTFLQAKGVEPVTFQIDTEDADQIQYIMVQGQDDLLSIKNGRVSISWQFDETIFLLVTDEPIEVAIAIAQNVRCVER